MVANSYCSKLTQYEFPISVLPYFITNLFSFSAKKYAHQKRN